MFENIIETSIFVRVLIFAITSILAINVLVALVNLGLNIFMKVKKLQ